MTRILLLRHAHSVANENGILAGRKPGISLSNRGLAQAKELATRLQGITFSQIRISPLERCSATVHPLISSFEKSVLKKTTIEIDEDLVEVDYGKWTGKKLAGLSRTKDWKVVQETPSAMYFPGGEGLLDVQTRAMRALNKIARSAGTEAKLLVSHGDVIKAIVASVLGTHLDHFQKIVIDPASITILDYNGRDFRVLTLNNYASPITSFIEKKSAKSANFKALLGGGAGRKN